MTRKIIPTLAVGLLVLGVGISSCSRQERTEPTDSTTTYIPGDQGAAIPDAGAGDAPGDMPGDTGAATGGRDTTALEPNPSPPPSGTRAELRGKLRTAATRLDRQAKAGSLKAAATSAVQVRDLAVALNGKTAGLPSGTIQQIEHDVSDLTQAVEELRIQAGAGKVDGVKGQNAVIQPIVADIIKQTGTGA